MTWDTILNYFGIKSFVYFISSSSVQDYLFPVKLIFVIFAMFFLAGVVYFMINSSWLQYKFLEEVSEFFSWQSYGMREISKQIEKIKKRTESGTEADYKLAIIEADDLLNEVLEDGGFEEDNFEESIKKAARRFAGGPDEILSAHQTRDSIVYNPDFKIPTERAKKVLDIYESAINSIGRG